MSHVILFVDDEAEVLGLLRKTFPHQDGYVTLTASSAEEALAILEKFEVDLLVTDQRMPGMDGLELQKRLSEAGIPIPLVFITAYEDPGVREQVMSAGAAAFLQKPFDNQLLMDAICTACK